MKIKGVRCEPRRSSRRVRRARDDADEALRKMHAKRPRIGRRGGERDRGPPIRSNDCAALAVVATTEATDLVFAGTVIATTAFASTGIGTAAAGWICPMAVRG